MKTASPGHGRTGQQTDPLPDDAILTPKGSKILQDVPYRFLCYVNRNQGAFIRLRTPLEMPELWDMARIAGEIQAKKIQIGGKFELPGFPKNYDELGNGTKRQKVYDDRIGRLRPAVDEVRVRLLDPETRTEEVRALAKHFKQSPRNIRDILKRVWAAGSDALGYAPALGNCGRGEHLSGEKVGRKRGGKNKYTVELPGEMSLDAAIRAEMRAHILSTWRPNVKSLRECHEEYLDENFGEKGRDLNFKKKMPSLNQYQYLARQLNRDGALERMALGEVEFDRKYKTYPGVHNHRIPGPNFRYIIDWTGLQLKVVSRLDRTKALKQASLYLIIDAWSSCIVGVYVCLAQTPSWADAKVALIYAFADKEKFCNRYKIPEKFARTWTCQYLPRQIQSDRGELVNKNTAQIPKGLEAILEFAESQDPDSKAAIERMVRTTKASLAKKLPGWWKKNSDGRDLGKRAGAKLALDEIINQVTLAVLKENLNPVPSHYIPSAVLQNPNQLVSRIGLYNWGLTNAAGAKRQLAESLIYDTLLDAGEGKLGPKGVEFKGLIYHDKEVISEGMLKRAVRAGGQVVQVRHDRMDASRILFRTDPSSEWIAVPCTDEEVIMRRLSFKECEARERGKRAAIADTRTATFAMRHGIADEEKRGIQAATRLTNQAKQKAAAKVSKSKFVKGDPQLDRAERSMHNSKSVEQIAPPRPMPTQPKQQARPGTNLKPGSIQYLKFLRRDRVRHGGGARTPVASAASRKGVQA